MIETISLTKKFDDIVALDSVSATIREGQVFGLIGTNGAGKSTFLRCLSGIYKPDGGEVRIDGGEVFEHVSVKSRFFFISDEQYFFPGATPLDMASSYGLYYRYFDRERFRRLLSEFGLDGRRKISTFSKGMKKQLSVILALSAYTDYIFCDETFDGLDPVMRQLLQRILSGEVADRGMTVVIASHNLRELEDICDHVGLFHKGGVIFDRELDALKLGISRVQAVFRPMPERAAFDRFDLVTMRTQGSLVDFVARGTQEEILAKLRELNPAFSELLPLTLEEVFISEMEAAGYDIDNILS